MSSQDKDEVLVVLHVQWSMGDQPLNSKMHLQRLLQVWFNRNSFVAAVTVLSAATDGRVVMKITPAPALHNLQKMRGRTLSRNDGRAVTIMSVSLTQSELETQIPEDASMSLPPAFVSEPQDVGGQLGKQSSDMVTCTCNIPMHHFWYVNQTYKKEIKRIEKESGVKIMAEAKMTFEANQKDGNPNNAFSEFINLVQKCSGESRGFTVPLKKVNPEEWKDVLKIAQGKENTVLLTVSSEEMTVRGPRQSQDVVRKSLNVTANTNTSVVETTQVSQDTSLNIGMSINDPLIDSGLTLESSRKLMTTSFDEQVAKTKESGISLSKVKACYQRSGGSTSVKSLYLKPATSSMSFTQQHGATAFSGSLKNWSNVYQSEGASGGPLLNRQSGYNTEAPTEGGATAGDKNQNAVRKSLNVTTNTSTSFGESTWASQEDKPPNIGMSINDPLVNAGLTMEESNWKLMTTSFNNQVAKITTKFGVDFKESGISQGKVEVKAHCRRSKNASMESHAVRALLHLYQKIASSPMSFTQHLGATGFTGSPSEEASGESMFNGQSGYNTEAPTEGGATAGDKSQDAVRKSLNVIANTSTSFGESTWASQEDKPPNIGMSINDPLVNAGLTMEESNWKLMTTSFNNQVAKIKTKFGVDFKESGISQGKVEVRAHCRRSKNASMESHAVRALLHLYQKIASSPMSFTQHLGATGFTGSPSEEASGESMFNGQSGYNTEAPTEGGATAGDDKDKICPICMDGF